MRPPISGAGSRIRSRNAPSRLAAEGSVAVYSRFRLVAPDAPGLVAFGAEFDPALADPLHAGSPLVSVSGVGLSLQEAFQGCIGEGIEYLSQLQTGATCCCRRPGEPAALLGPQARDFSPRSGAPPAPIRHFHGFLPGGSPIVGPRLAAGGSVPAPAAGPARVRAAVSVE